MSVDVPLWREAKTAFLSRIAATTGTLKIVLKTKDDNYFLERWITHHAGIVGLGNLVIFDCMSSHAGVHQTLRKYRANVPIVRFADPYNNVHKSQHVPELYECLKASCEFFAFLDTDEFLVHIAEDAYRCDARILDYLRRHPDTNAFPGTWLVNVSGYRARFKLGRSIASLGGGLAFGKPIVRASAYVLGTQFIHNIEVSRSLFAREFHPHCFVLHLKNLDHLQRLEANLRKLKAASIVAPDQTLQSIVRMDFEESNLARGWTRDLRRFASNSSEPFEDAARDGWLELAADGSVRYSSHAHANVIHRFLTQGQRLWDEVRQTTPAAFFGNPRREEHRWQVLVDSDSSMRPAAADWTILFVSHDAAKAGAQTVLVEFIGWLKAHTSVRAKILCLDGGDYLPRFAALGDTILRSEIEQRIKDGGQDAATVLRDFCQGTPSLIYANSVASGPIYAQLATLGAPILTHVHELESSIARYGGAWIADVLKESTHYIACSEPVRDTLVAAHAVPAAAISVVHSFINPDEHATPVSSLERAALRRRLGLPVDKRLVIGCGTATPFRKGADLFIDVARLLHRRGREDVHFCWIGHFEPSERDSDQRTWAEVLASVRPDERQPVEWLGWTEDPRPYLRASDVFVLSSREDPFPLAALEAAAVGLPIICFDHAGGMPAFVRDDAGCIVPYGQIEPMAAAVDLMLCDEAQRHNRGARARTRLLEQFTTDAKAPHLLSTCRTIAGKTPRVSVIVPNYNHARYLPERLSSIFNQTYRDFEVILLDDASTDGSGRVLEAYRGHADVRIVKNARNSGSPFAQWLKGIDQARAEIIWIAESDDRCDAELLAALLPAFDEPTVKLAYANSHVIDKDGAVVGDYITSRYLTSLSSTKWTQNYYRSAEREINDGLGVKNTILSASSALFRKFELSPEVRGTLKRMRIAGDWYLFTHAIRDGDVAYTARKLNHHRRHDESVIGTLLKQRRVAEFYRELYTVQRAIFKNYRVDESFPSKWERYLTDQFREFFPGRRVDDLEQYYPLVRARKAILASLAPAKASPSRSRRTKRGDARAASPAASFVTERRLPICIAGMHRSGTSMVARLLNLAGLYLGEPADLMRPVDHNPEGFWENLKFVALNDEVLNAIGGGWDHPVRLPSRWERVPRLVALKARAERVLAEFVDREPWGWKDPRTSLTLPFWQSVAGRLKVILCVRHPLEVVLSLRARNFFSDSLGLNLWQTHNQRVLDATRKEDRIVTHYDAYFDNPRAELQRLHDFAGLTVHPDELDGHAATIAGRLRHHHLTSADLAAAELAPDLADLYNRLLVEAGRPDDVLTLTARAPSRTARRSSVRATDGPAPAPRVNGLVMDLVRERDTLKSALNDKNIADRAHETTLTERDATIRDVLAEMNTLRGQRDHERQERGRERQEFEQQQQRQLLELTKQLEYEQLRRRLYFLLDETIPRGATVLIVSRGDDTLLHLNGRRVWHFPRTADGIWNGHPADSQEAIAQLEAVRATGSAYLVFPRPAFWWLDHYAELGTYLNQRCRLAARRNDTAVIFEMSHLTA